MVGYTFHGMNLSQFVLWFFIYSFCGWAMECVVIRVQLGVWQNRGFAKLPFCVIYGFGTWIAYNLFAPIEHNYAAIYIWGCICATIFEYLTARIMLKLFGEVWWNYEHKKINYKGILCLESTLAWGVLALFIFGIFNNLVEGLVFILPQRFVLVTSSVLLFAYLTDFSVQFIRNLIGNNRQSFENVCEWLKVRRK
jgi:uncharacterized membrane protein